MKSRLITDRYKTQNVSYADRQTDYCTHYIASVSTEANLSADQLPLVSDQLAIR